MTNINMTKRLQPFGYTNWWFNWLHCRENQVVMESIPIIPTQHSINKDMLAYPAAIGS